MDDRSINEDGKSGLPFTFRKKVVAEEVQKENWLGVEAAIRRQAERTPVRTMPWGALMAAATLLVAVAGIWWFEARTGNKPLIAEVRTGYGEVKHILLLDSSVVILNANSSMRIPQQWTDEDKDGRQVWLDGEAYFEVQKKASTRQKFVVHTDKVDVIVLGTKFNVHTRRQHAIVALEEGKVQLSVHGVGQSVLEKPASMVLRPGQVVIVGEEEKVKVNNDKDVTSHSGWSRNEFHFDNTSLEEIGRLIEDTYGYKIAVSDTSLLQRSVSGDLRAANVEELVRVLEFTLKLTMRIDNKTIYVTNP
jgi:ferric-dicitrate binding protein FerR (iron transport regulator)